MCARVLTECEWAQAHKCVCVCVSALVSTFSFSVALPFFDLCEVRVRFWHLSGASCNRADGSGGDGNYEADEHLGRQNSL